MAKNKRPKTKANIGPGVAPRGGRSLVDPTRPSLVSDDHPTFSFHYADRTYAGAWSWPTGDAAAELLHFLCEMSKLTWGQILGQASGPARSRHKKHHAMDFDTVCPEAQARLAELRLDEIFEELFRFRLSGKCRLWGFRIDSTFYVLWWDPKHAIYPT